MKTTSGSPGLQGEPVVAVRRRRLVEDAGNSRTLYPGHRHKSEHQWSKFTPGQNRRQ